MVNHGVLFCNLTSDVIAEKISDARRSVCYAAPSIQLPPAKAIVDVAQKISREMLTVCLDLDEQVMRMGYGNIEAVKKIRDAQISIRSISKIRIGILIIDQYGFIFSPTAQLLEAESKKNALNAMRLSKKQASEALARLSPETKTIALELAETEDERIRISKQPIDIAVPVKSREIEADTIKKIDDRLNEAPPDPFDVTRMVRIYSSYVQYAKFSLVGTEIERKKIVIPPRIQNYGVTKELENRLHTTFDLIEKNKDLSSKHLRDELNQIRENYTPSLGPEFQGDRVVLKSVKKKLEKYLDGFEIKLENHKQKIEKELQKHLDKSQQLIVEYYTPIVAKDLPPTLLGQGIEDGDEESAREWISSELNRVFPKAEDLIRKMRLIRDYKDVTINTLNSENFLNAIKEAFPQKEWDKVYEEAMATMGRKI